MTLFRPVGSAPLCLAAVGLAAGCGGRPAVESAVDRFDGERARRIVADVVQPRPGFGGVAM